MVTSRGASDDARLDTNNQASLPHGDVTHNEHQGAEDVARKLNLNSVSGESHHHLHHHTKAKVESTATTLPEIQLTNDAGVKPVALNPLLTAMQSDNSNDKVRAHDAFSNLLQAAAVAGTTGSGSEATQNSALPAAFAPNAMPAPTFEPSTGKGSGSKDTPQALSPLLANFSSGDAPQTFSENSGAAVQASALVADNGGPKTKDQNASPIFVANAAVLEGTALQASPVAAPAESNAVKPIALADNGEPQTKAQKALAATPKNETSISSVLQKFTPTQTSVNVETFAQTATQNSGAPVVVADSADGKKKDAKAISTFVASAGTIDNAIPQTTQIAQIAPVAPLTPGMQIAQLASAGAQNAPIEQTNNTASTKPELAVSPLLQKFAALTQTPALEATTPPGAAADSAKPAPNSQNLATELSESKTKAQKPAIFVASAAVIDNALPQVAQIAPVAQPVQLAQVGQIPQTIAQTPSLEQNTTPTVKPELPVSPLLQKFATAIQTPGQENSGLNSNPVDQPSAKQILVADMNDAKGKEQKIATFVANAPVIENTIPQSTQIAPVLPVAQVAQIAQVAPVAPIVPAGTQAALLEQTNNAASTRPELAVSPLLQKFAIASQPNIPDTTVAATAPAAAAPLKQILVADSSELKSKELKPAAFASNSGTIDNVVPPVAPIAQIAQVSQVAPIAPVGTQAAPLEQTVAAPKPELAVSPLLQKFAIASQPNIPDSTVATPAPAAAAPLKQILVADTSETKNKELKPTVFASNSGTIDNVIPPVAPIAQVAPVAQIAQVAPVGNQAAPLEQTVAAPKPELAVSPLLQRFAAASQPNVTDSTVVAPASAATAPLKQVLVADTNDVKNKELKTAVFASNSGTIDNVAPSVAPITQVPQIAQVAPAVPAGIQAAPLEQTVAAAKPELAVSPLLQRFAAAQSNITDSTVVTAAPAATTPLKQILVADTSETKNKELKTAAFASNSGTIDNVVPQATQMAQAASAAPIAQIAQIAPVGTQPSAVEQTITTAKTEPSVSPLLQKFATATQTASPDATIASATPVVSPSPKQLATDNSDATVKVQKAATFALNTPVIDSVTQAITSPTPRTQTAQVEQVAATTQAKTDTVVSPLLAKFASSSNSSGVEAIPATVSVPAEAVVVKSPILVADNSDLKAKDLKAPTFTASSGSIDATTISATTLATAEPRQDLTKNKTDIAISSSLAAFIPAAQSRPDVSPAASDTRPADMTQNKTLIADNSDLKSQKTAPMFASNAGTYDVAAVSVAAQATVQPALDSNLKKPNDTAVSPVLEKFYPSQTAVVPNADNSAIKAVALADNSDQKTSQFAARPATVEVASATTNPVSAVLANYSNTQQNREQVANPKNELANATDASQFNGRYVGPGSVAPAADQAAQIFAAQRRVGSGLARESADPGAATTANATDINKQFFALPGTLPQVNTTALTKDVATGKPTDTTNGALTVEQFKQLLGRQIVGEQAVALLASDALKTLISRQLGSENVNDSTSGKALPLSAIEYKASNATPTAVGTSQILVNSTSPETRQIAGFVDSRLLDPKGAQITEISSTAIRLTGTHNTATENTITAPGIITQPGIKNNVPIDSHVIQPLNIITGIGAINTTQTLGPDGKAVVADGKATLIDPRTGAIIQLPTEITSTSKSTETALILTGKDSGKATEILEPNGTKKGDAKVGDILIDPSGRLIGKAGDKKDSKETEEEIKNAGTMSGAGGFGGGAAAPNNAQNNDPNNGQNNQSTVSGTVVDPDPTSTLPNLEIVDGRKLPPDNKDAGTSPTSRNEMETGIDASTPNSHKEDIAGIKGTEVDRLFGTRKNQIDVDENSSQNASLRAELMSLEARRTYKVKRGESLADIARRELGNADYMQLLIELNIDSLTFDRNGKVVLAAGCEIYLPSRADILRFVAYQEQERKMLLAFVDARGIDTSSQVVYACRLGDSLVTIAKRHPAVKDARLWKLIAELNNLSTKKDKNGLPVARLHRGQHLLLPTIQQKNEYIHELAFGTKSTDLTSDFVRHIADNVPVEQTPTPTKPTQSFTSDQAITQDAESEFTSRLITQSDLGDTGDSLVMRLELKVDGVYMPVVEYAIGFGSATVSVHTKSGEMKTTNIDLPNRSARELAESDLAANSDTYCRNFENNVLPY